MRILQTHDHTSASTANYSTTTEAWAAGYTEGHDEGYTEGHDEGFEIGKESAEQEHKYAPDSAGFWFSLGFALFLVCFAGMASGLTVGYLSIDELQLELKMKNGTEEEKQDAMVIIPILAKHHLLLSTLLLANALAMEALPLFLDAIVPAWAAVMISTSLVLVFGEVIPQAYCTGPAQIKIAKTLAPVIKFLMFIFYPICYPISVGLDNLLGLHHKTRFVKKDLKALIELHKMEKPNAPKSGAWGHDAGHEIKTDAALTGEEIKVINSTIDLRDTPVTKEMEKIENVFTISSTTTIDPDMVKRFCKSGYSKIPVYRSPNRNQVIGFLKVKSLLDPRYVGMTIEQSRIPLIPTLIVPKDTSMLEMLMLFQEKKTSIALVCEETAKDKGQNAIYFTKRNQNEDGGAVLIGLISLKDIFEEILEAKMDDDDLHNPVTLMSGAGNRMKKGNKPMDYSEAYERPEKGLKKPLLAP
jgi:metal transporter CNNM